MLPLYRTISLRYLSRRWFRAALVVASIMLGVGTLVATQALSETMSKATVAAGNPMAGTIDLIVTNGEFPIDRNLAKELEPIKGIKDIRAKVFDQAKIVVGDKKITVMIMGFDLSTETEKPGTFEELFVVNPEMDKVKVSYISMSVLGRIPVILGDQLEKDLDKEVPTDFFGHKIIPIEKSLQKHTVYSIGSVKPKLQGDLAAFGGYLVIAELDHAAAIVGLPPGKARRIDIALAPGVDPKQIRMEIEKILAGRAEVRTTEEQNQSLQTPMVGMKAGFSMCGVAALIVGMFLVYNSLSVSVAERRHEIGMLRRLGATRSQIWRLFAGEAFVLGIVGAALGIPLGLSLAYVGLQTMQDVINEFVVTMNYKQIEIGWELVALAFIVGILSSVIASLVPAVQAAYDKPAEAVRKIPKEPPVSHLVMHIFVVGLLILSGMAMIYFRESVPKRWGTYGGLSLVMIGALVAAPLFAQLGARALMPIARQFFPIEWRIAADNLIRAPGRTGMVIAALAAGVCLIVETAGIIRSNRLTIRQWVDDSIAADVIVTSGSPVGAGGQNTLMPVSFADELRREIPEIEEVMPVRQNTEVLFRTERVAILNYPADQALQHEKKRLKKLDHLKLYQAMVDEPNAVIVSGNFAVLHHVHAGDFITLKSPRGEVKFHVVGTMEDYSWNLGTIIMNRRDYVEHWNDTTVSVFDVYLRDGADATEVKDKIAKKLGAQYDLHALTRDELKTRIDTMVARLYRIALAQEIVVIVVAALGVVTALLISVLQRKREMGLLRAIGASQAQVIYLVLAEAGLMGVFGSILGILFAIPLQWYALQIVLREESGYDFGVYFAWGDSALVALFAIIIATLAGLGPALYAVRERIPDAIAYE